MAWLLPIAAPSQAYSEQGSEDEALEEIVVTARKREEDLLRVPMSVQVLPGKFVDDTNASSLYTLQYDIPGLVVANVGLHGAGIALRGITNEGGSNIAVTAHIDGVYLGDTGLALARLFDLERIEVLKGPQGTLYGRNATGGSINIITSAPQREFSAGVESALGSFDTLRIRGHVNVPSDKYAVRLAVVGSNGDGYIRNSVDDRRFAEEDYFGVRASLAIWPTDRFSINAMAQHVADDGATAELWMPRNDYFADPNDIRLTTVTLPNPYLSMTNDVATVEWHYEFERATLRSISGYARNETHDLDDCAASPRLLGCVRGAEPSIYEQWSQEFHLDSTMGSSLDWLIGAFFLGARESTHYLQIAPLISSVPLNEYYARSDNEAYAAFGQATYRAGERWSVTGGLRLSHETTDVSDRGTGRDDNHTLTAADGSWDNTSWRLDLQYAPREQTLLYASMATGFKSGGITTQKLPTGEFDGYDPEQLTAYELGAKWRSADGHRTLLASAFLYDFRDLQVHTVTVLANTITSRTGNAAVARIHGLDLSTGVDLGDRLSLSGGLVWMPKREFIDYTSDDTGETLSGNTLSRAPEWSVTASAGYRLPLRHAGELSARIDYNYRSEFFFNGDNEAWQLQEAFGLLNLYLRLDSTDESWYLFASGRNLLDSDYFNQVYIQASPGYPATYEAGVGLHF